LPASHYRQAVLSQAMGNPGESLANIVAGMVHNLGLPSRLQDAGVRYDQISIIARAALADARVKANIRAIDTERAMTQLIEAAF